MIAQAIMIVLLVLFTILLVVILFHQIVIRIILTSYPQLCPVSIVRIIDNPIRRRVQPPKRVVDWIDIQEGMEVLEIGPGTGLFTIEAARRAGPKGNVYAIDIQPEVISMLDDRLQREGIANTKTETGSVYDLPYLDDTFDRVFMVAVIGELRDKKKALREIKRILKEDGLLAIAEFVPDPDYRRAKTVMNWCRQIGLEIAYKQREFLHYLVTFRKAMEKREENPRF